MVNRDGHADTLKKGCLFNENGYILIQTATPLAVYAKLPKGLMETTGIPGEGERSSCILFLWCLYPFQYIYVQYASVIAFLFFVNFQPLPC
jgi:hypothetical protein